MIARVAYELQMFRSLAGFLVGAGMTVERAELWARAAVDRYRHARRHGTDARRLFTLETADRYAALDAQGCDPRSWI